MISHIFLPDFTKLSQKDFIIQLYLKGAETDGIKAVTPMTAPL